MKVSMVAGSPWLPCPQPCARLKAVPPPAVTGEIRSTRRLEVAGAQLLIQAYNALQPSDQDTIVLNVTVRGTDQRAPSCVPALYVYGSRVLRVMLHSAWEVELSSSHSHTGPRCVRPCPLAARW